MSEAESTRAIAQALRPFAAQSLKVGATGSFNALGYASKKTLELKPNGIEGFMTDSCFVSAAFTNNFRP